MPIIRETHKQSNNISEVTVYGKYTDFDHDQLNELLETCAEYKAVSYGGTTFVYFTFYKTSPV